MNAEQLMAAHSPHARNIVIAGPGAGKTTTIINRAKFLCDQGIKPADMAFVTFTNVGAMVLNKRLSDAVGRVGFVGTLHGMMIKLLRRNDPRWIMISEEDAEDFLQRQAKRFAYKGSASSLEEARRKADDNTPASRVIRAYRQFLRDERLLDFDMVLTEGLSLLKSGSILLPWKCLFADEFQDTAHVDAQIYLEAKPDHLFAVGDPDQSIFQFRGARPQNVKDFWDDPSFSRHVLPANYRCSETICQAANAVIAQNRKRIEKETISATEHLGEVQTEIYSNADDEFREVSLQVKRLIDSGTAPHEIAVLCRTNRLVAAMRVELTAKSVPIADYQTDRKPKDWRLLRLILAQISAPFNWGNAKLLARLQAKQSGLDPDSAEKIVAGWKIRGDNPAIQWGLPAASTVLSLNADLSRFGIGNASQQLLNERIRFYAPSSIEELIEVMNENPEAKATRGVNVMTVHASKGEEFDAVIIPGADLFTQSNEEDMEEERRLMFVAITRARKFVSVSGVKSRSQILPNGQVLVKQGDLSLLDVISAANGAIAV